MSDISPVFLFSDSQLMFWKRNGDLFLKTLLKYVNEVEPKAAYIGYSNNNQPEFFEIFRSGMESIGIKHCRMLEEDFSNDDKQFVNEASLILLAGGDVVEGWKKIESTGLKDIVLKRFSEGAVLIGVSAGAIQLGLRATGGAPASESDSTSNFQILPFIVGVHEEADDWVELKAQVLSRGEHAKAIGIPFGSGFAYHPDRTIEPIKSSIVEISVQNRAAVVNILFPNDSQETNNAQQQTSYN